MAISGKFVADFEAFYAATQKAEVSLRSFEEGSGKVTRALNTMANSFSGQKIISDATLMTEAVTRAGGAATLTDREMARVNATVNDAIAKYRALGGVAPQSMLDLAAATKKIPPELDHVVTKSAALTSGLKSVAGALGLAFGAAAVVAGAKRLITDVLATADQVHDLSEKLGVSTEAVQRWGFAAKQTGADMGQVSTSLAFMNKTLAGGTDSTKWALDAAGLGFATIRAMAPEQAFETIAGAIKKIPDPMLQAKVAVELFGKSGQDLLPGIKEGFVEIGREAPVMADATINALEAAGDAVDKFQANLSKRVGTTMGVLALAVEELGKGTQGVKNWASALYESGGQDEKFIAALMRMRTEQNALTADQQRWVKTNLEAGMSTDLLVRGVGATKDGVLAYIDSLKKLVPPLRETEADHRKAAAAAKTFAKEFATNTDAVKKLEAGFAGLHTAVALANTDEIDLIKHLLAGKTAADNIERSFRGMDIGLENIGKHNDDIRELVKSLQRMYEVERVIPAGFYQIGVALDSLGVKSTEIDLLKTKVAAADVQTKTWSESLTGLARAFEQMATIGGDQFGSVARSIGMAVVAGKALNDVMGLMGDVSSGAKAGGWSASNLAAIAAGWVGVATAMYSVIAATYAQWAAQNKLDNELSRAAALSKALNTDLGNTYMFSLPLQKAIDDLAESFKKLNLKDSLGNALGLRTAEALKMVDIIKELGGASQLTAAQLQMIKSDTIANLLDLITQGGPLASLAMAQLTGLFETFVPSLDDVTAAAERLGLTFDDLGTLGQQLRVNEDAASAVKAFETLQKAGLDTSIVFDKMSAEVKASFQKMASDALKAGLTIPDGMKPILQGLADSGDLTDEFGEQLTDLSRFNFAKPLEQMVGDLIAALDRLVAKFGDVGAAAANIKVPSWTAPSVATGQDWSGPPLLTAPIVDRTRGTTIIEQHAHIQVDGRDLARALTRVTV